MKANNIPKSETSMVLFLSLLLFNVIRKILISAIRIVIYRKIDPEENKYRYAHLYFSSLQNQENN